MDAALVVGGTRFIGRHTVEELLANGYEVTLFNRGQHENPFESDDRVGHVAGDRGDRDALESARDAVDPDVVVDCVAYAPDEVEAATEVFADVGAYVVVSSVAAYDKANIIKREGEPLLPCTPEQARDDSMETYGPRKAEGDRVVAAAAEDGVRAMSVRPTIVYGPHDYLGQFGYWVDRVLSHDRVLVPGDGSYLMHRSYVEDVAAGLRVVAESGEPGEAYNVGDPQVHTLAGTVELIADVAGRDVEVVTADERALATADLSMADFPLVMGPPNVMVTEKLAALGWAGTPQRTAIERTVADHREHDREPAPHAPERADEERVIDVLETV